MSKKLQQQHSRQVWEDFWQEKQEIDQVYSNSDRIINQLEQLGDLQGKWILEVGAGSGRDSFYLLKKGARVITLDYAQSSLDIIRQQFNNAEAKPLLIRADAFRLPFKDSVIDIVFHQGLLEHFERPEGILLENYRVTKQGGFTLADVPQKYHLYTVVKHLLIKMNKWFAGWETEFTKGQMESMFRGCGFAIHKIYGDWMRPSFIYRAIREALKKIGIKLPLYPKSIPLLGQVRKAIRKALRKSSISYYTFMDIGVIGIKEKR